MKKLSKQEKWMLALAAALLVGIIVRWGFIKREAGEAFRERIEVFQSKD